MIQRRPKQARSATVLKSIAFYIVRTFLRQKLRIVGAAHTPTTAKNYPYFFQIGLINLKKRHKSFIFCNSFRFFTSRPL